MATIGVKVVGGPKLALGEIFKNAFGDPEQKAKLALISSQIWGQEHQNQLYDASTEEKRQLAAKAQQEADILKANQEAQDAAAGPLGEDFAAKVPMPVAVDHTPQFAQSLIGPGMPYISPDQQTSYASGTAAARALARAYTHSGSNAEQLQKAVQGQYGAGALSAALGPGGPAAVDLSPDQMRAALALTGQMPTKDTVITSGDFAGVNAATKGTLDTERGKALIDANKPAIVDIPGRGKVSLTPTGGGSGQIIAGTQPGLTKENAPQVLAALNAKAAATGGKLTDPADIALRDAAQQIMTTETMIKRGKDESLLTPGGAGQPLTQVAGPDPNVSADPYSSNAVGADSKNIIARTVLKMIRGQPLTDADSVNYRMAYESEHPNKPIVVKDANGIPSTIDPVPPPPDLPTPEEVDAAVAAGPVAGGAAATIPPDVARLGASPAGAAVRPAFIGRTALPGDGAVKIAGLDAAPPPTEFQQKSRQFASPLINATLELDKVTADTLPGKAAAATISSTSGDSGGPSSFVGDYGNLVLRDVFLGGPDTPERLYERSLNAYIGPELYALSGMAIKPEEFARQMSANAPKYGDGPETLARKTVDRHNFAKAVVDGGYATDPKELAKQYALAKQGGLDLTNYVLYDGNKTSMMPPTTAGQIAAVTAGLKGAPALDVAAPAPAPDAPAAPAASPSPMVATPPVAPAAGAKLPPPAAPQGFTTERFSRLWNAMTVEQQQTYLNNLKHQGQ